MPTQDEINKAAASLKPGQSLNPSNLKVGDTQSAGGGPAGWPSLPGSFAGMINFEGAFTDFMGAYEEIRGVNEKIFGEINKQAEADAKRLGVSFTEANLANFETAMERVQPGYKGLLNKTTGVVQDWLFGRIPEDVATNVLMQASNRALRSGIGEGGFARNLLARDFGMTSLQLQQQGVGQAQQLVNAARQTARSLIANVEQLYGTNLSARANSQMMSPGQYVSMVAQQDQFNAQGEFQESQAKASMEQQYSQFAYQDALNRYAATQKPKQKSGVMGDIFGDKIGAVLDPIADVAVPLIATVATGGNIAAGAAAGAAWGGLQANSRGTDIGQGAMMGGVSGGVSAYAFGQPLTQWWQGMNAVSNPAGNMVMQSAAGYTGGQTPGVFSSFMTQPGTAAPATVPFRAGTADPNQYLFPTSTYPRSSSVQYPQNV